MSWIFSCWRLPLLLSFLFLLASRSWLKLSDDFLSLSVDNEASLWLRWKVQGYVSKLKGTLCDFVIGRTDSVKRGWKFKSWFQHLNIFLAESSIIFVSLYHRMAGLRAETPQPGGSAIIFYFFRRRGTFLWKHATVLLHDQNCHCLTVFILTGCTKQNWEGSQSPPTEKHRYFNGKNISIVKIF